MMTIISRRFSGSGTAAGRGQWLVDFALLLAGSLALTRILYEGLFPRWWWLARPFPVVSISLGTAVLLTWVVNRTRIHADERGWFLLPLMLNLLWLFDPAVDLVRSRLVFGASLWLAALLLLARASAAPRAWRWLGPLFVLAALLPVYLLTMPNAVGQADTFEFQVVAPQLGLAHPTGYPLFLLLGKLFTLIPLNTVAWRLNFAVMVYGLAAACLLFGLGYRLRARGEVAVVTAVTLGLIPTFWSQSIEAEVYTLHALIVVAALFVMREMGDWRLVIGDSENASHTPTPALPLSRSPLLLFFLLGLGLTNHLTTVFLLPAAALTLWFAGYFRRKSLIANLQSLLLLALAFALPLLLYAYLPLRWTAVNHEPMGLSRFVDWVIGGRFQGALQWRAWLDDPTRYEVVGRIYLNNWGWVNLAIAALGLITLLIRRWQFALILLITWVGVTFYALNYYVPDLAVFLMGAQVVTAVFWLAGANWVVAIGDWKLQTKPNLQSLVSSLLLLLLILPTLLLAVAHWPQIDQSGDDGLMVWGQGVLEMPLAEGAAILADSEKIAPLYYLQQAEGVRPDLDIMVLPDEAAYRAELDQRLAAGQAVYLARFLPGLEGVYYLRSMGPLTEVSLEPLTTLPDTAVSSPLAFDNILLLAYEWQPEAAIDPTQAALTLYWQPNNPTNQPLQVYLRLGDYTSDGRFPANNFYPTNAWKGDEIVPDFYLLPRPILDRPQKLNLQIALAPPFTPPDALDWQKITAVSLPATPFTNLPQPIRAQIGPAALLSVDFAAQIRPQQPLNVLLSGYGEPSGIQAVLLAEGETLPNLPLARVIYRGPLAERPFTMAKTVVGVAENGRYQLVLTRPGQTLICGWLQPVSVACPLGDVVVSGAPLPAGAINYDDKIALLDVAIANTTLQPGGQLALTLQWQGLAPIADDYTVFLQVVDAQDRLVGQVDAWPLQGTLPTSQWMPGQTITDPYTIQLDPDMPPGAYRLLIGWYLLADLRRLPILNADGAPVDDKLAVSGLMVE